MTDLPGRIHLIELGGFLGIYQHSLELARQLQAEGVPVRLHTSVDAEIRASELDVCYCFRRRRRYLDASAAPRFAPLRQAATLAYMLGRVMPHLYRSLRAGDVAHLQGLNRLTPELIAMARRRGATVVTSPHDTFTKPHLYGLDRSLRRAVDDADRVFVYSRADARVLAERGCEAAVVPLVQWSRPADPERVRHWRERLGAGPGTPLAVMPGAVRPRKDHQLFVRAIALLPDWRGAVVGQDWGNAAEVDRTIAETGAPVATAYGYLEPDEFLAVVAAADVVVAPYAQCSQSGVLVVAERLGVPSAVVATGGLAELGTTVATDRTPQALRDAIIAARGRSPVPADPAAAVPAYLAEYRIARQRAERHVAAAR